MFRTRVLRATLTLLLLVTLPIVSGAQEVTPSVTVSDQPIEDGTVTVDMVVAAGLGWIVIHIDEDGSPGPVIGQAAVEEGENEDVEVEIDEDQATDTLHAMLHDDLGTVGTYEFPGADVPVQLNGEIVMEPFQVQAQETPPPAMTPEATPEATPAATPEETPEPGVLPETGGFTPWALILVAAGAVALFSGVALASVRRPH
jgi:hypothetical protein